MKEIAGSLVAAGLNFGIVAGRFNSFVSEKLIEGAVDAIVRHGGSDANITVVRVPGSFELPIVAKKMAESKKVDAVIALGVIIRGATNHYDLVCNEAAKGIGAVGLSTMIPVAFGVVTADTLDQAIERAGSKAGNKGWDAALTAIEMVNVLKELK